MTKKAVKKKTVRQPVHVEEMRAFDEECWRLYLRGASIRDLSLAFGKPVDAISQSLQRGVEQKQNLPPQSVRAYLEKLIDEINLIRQAAWSGWERSQMDLVKSTEKNVSGGTGGGRDESTVITVGQAGDTSFLRIIAECNKREATLRGIEKPGHSLFQFMQTYVDIDTLIVQVEAANAADVDESPQAALITAVPMPEGEVTA